MTSPAHFPYKDSTWAKIKTCGASVETSLKDAGVFLTIGGEPTFVPLAPNGAEWRTAALGPTKLGYARRLAREFIQTAFRGAVVLATAGKHYPGEPLPRWTLLLQKRTDGESLWRDPLRLCGGLATGTHTIKEAERFIRNLTQALRLDAVGGSALTLAETTAPAEVIGYVLPLDHVEASEPGRAWITDNWRAVFGDNSVALIPGESVFGLRLPLDRLGENHLKRALTTEIIAGTLTIFIPPLSLLGYTALLAVIEATLEALDLRDVVLAGYPPPTDAALTTVGLASDPGVIEINIAPCAQWIEYDEQLTQLYVAASAAGLCARKLHYNGRELGTGGGAHLVFGGPLGRTSPFFEFPAFLPSIIRYWQHHPALSYAFTGTYLGPSSQAPRIDESTYEALYELEIACAGAENLGSPQNLALYDLLFRDLLMDRSGNTHRAEISVDKLWNPFAPNGRLGLVEFRAFETNPHSAVQSVTALFIRAILARLIKSPFASPFIRWSGELHDKYFLPAFIWDDLSAICADLARHRLHFEVEWLRAAWEFRFPLIGELPIGHPTRAGALGSLRFRQALEAWPLLGESPHVGTVSRTVDASLDRIEAHLPDGALLETGALLVNGFPVEFRPAVGGGAAAGIRYRAFYLTPSLQPHVPVHAPLLLEWVDRKTLTVLVAARWHVWNRTHTAYVQIPSDDEAARARRAERWETWPHTIGQARYIPRIDFPPEGKHTLDLRRYPAQAR